MPLDQAAVTPLGLKPAGPNFCPEKSAEQGATPAIYHTRVMRLGEMRLASSLGLTAVS